MSGYPAFGTWATAETDYPAGSNPWNGTPVIVGPPAQDYFTPDTKPPAQTFNYLFNKLFAQDTAVLVDAWSGILNNWQEVVLSSSSSFNTVASDTFAASPQAITWEPLYGSWRIALNAVGASQTQIWDTIDGGRTFFKIGELPSAQNIVAAASGAGQSLWVIGNGTSTPATFAGLGTTGTVTSFTGPGDYTSSASLYFPTTSSFITYGGAQNSSVWNGVAIAVTSVTAQTGTISAPSGQFSGGTDHVGNIFATQSPTTMVWVIAGITPGTDTAHLMTVTWNGSAYTATEVTPTFLGSTYIVTGLAYDAVDGLFAMLVYNGTSSFIYTSPATLTTTSWSLAATFTNLVYQGLAIVGDGASVWAICAPFPNTSFHSGTSRVLISTNQVQNGLVNTSPTYSPTQSPMATFGYVAGNGNQLVAFNATHMEISFAPGQLS
jgi:hypothetical protein